MPRPATTGYERLAQADVSDDSDDDPLAASYASLQPPTAPRYAPIGQPRPHSGMATPKYSESAGLRDSSRSGGRHRRRGRRNSGVDLKAINARLERWADEIASKFKRGRNKKKGEEERLEIHHSVFQPPEGVRPVTAEMLAVPEPGYMTKAEFEVIVDSVRSAIRQGVHPRMISQGSSGSYFARNPDGKVVGVFKPKDEEPYAAGNPKWNKWIHRNLFPCFFGRAWSVNSDMYPKQAVAMLTHLLVSSPTFPTLAKPPRTFSTRNYAHTSSRTQMSFISRPSPSTTPFGTVTPSLGRGRRCPQNQAASKSSSRASRMQTFFCGNTHGQISICRVSGQQILIENESGDGPTTAVRAARSPTTEIATMATTAPSRKRQAPAILFGHQP